MRFNIIYNVRNKSIFLKCQMKNVLDSLTMATANAVAAPTATGRRLRLLGMLPRMLLPAGLARMLLAGALPRTLLASRNSRVSHVFFFRFIIY